MVQELYYDITTYKSSLNSLSKLTNLNEEDIKTYIMFNEDNYSVNHFLEEFNIADLQLLEKNLWLVSLHVTTNNNNCDSIKEHGLINLQKTIQHKGKVFDISKEYNGFSDEEDRTLDFIVYKLFKDYQINGFFSYDNVLEYGGYVNNRPEFLYNLAEFLKIHDLEYDWIKNNKCFVIKFVAPLSDYTDWTFINKLEMEHLNKEKIEIKKRKWIIAETLANIYYGFLGQSVKDSFSYLRPSKCIPYSSIIKIYTDDEYLKSYGYKKN